MIRCNSFRGDRSQTTTCMDGGGGGVQARRSRMVIASILPTARDGYVVGWRGYWRGRTRLAARRSSLDTVDWATGRPGDHD